MMHILLADDHNLVRDGLKPFLREMAPSVTLAEAASVDEALTAGATLPHIDLVLLDLRMPGMDGFKGIERVRARFPEARLVILSGFVSRAEVMAAAKAGADGFIPKTVSGSALINALRLVMAGETYLPSSILLSDGNDESQATSPASLDSPLIQSLSARERQILGLLIEGKTNKEIARKLDLQEITIKIHLRNVYRKIGAANRAQAVRIAMTAGWPT